MRTTKNSITEEKEKGRIYTPYAMVQTILNLSGYRGEGILKKHVMDNSCGDGAFLEQVVGRYCLEASVREDYGPDRVRAELQKYVHGIEIDGDECRKCRERLDEIAGGYFGFRAGEINWDVRQGDALKEDGYDGRMDFVVGNPPYVRVHNMGDAFSEAKKFKFAQEGMTDLFLVFYEIGLRMLNGTGTLGYITPSSMFTSRAGSAFREAVMEEGLLDKVMDLKHWQVFGKATAYTAVVVLKKGREKGKKTVSYRFDTGRLVIAGGTELGKDDFHIGGKFFFAEKGKLDLLKKVLQAGEGEKNGNGAQARNGYATLCDVVFTGDFKGWQDDTPYIIPAVKASKGQETRILYPYDREGRLVPEEEIMEKDRRIYEYLTRCRDILTARDIRDGGAWYAFGRSQGIADTWKDKLAIGSMMKGAGGIKITEAPAGTGVYGGLYVICGNVPTGEIRDALTGEDFFDYVSLLGKYKSGGWYSFSSKDLQAWLNYRIG